MRRESCSILRCSPGWKRVCELTNLGAVLAARGVTTVALNEQGELTEYRPDGTSASV